MTITEFYRTLEDTLELDTGSIQGPEKLAELDNWDSLAPLSLIAMADQRFGMTLSASAVRDCKTVHDLAALFAEKITK